MIKRFMPLWISGLMFTIPIISMANLRPFYYQRFEAYNVYTTFSSTKSEINRQFESVLQYINFPFQSQIDPKFFSSEDRLHMQDVRTWLIVVYTVAASCLILIFLSRPGTRQQLHVLTKIWIGLIVVVAIIAVISVFWWQQLFILFHQIFFPTNQYWLLDPASSNLIKYFMNPIFKEAAIVLGVVYLLELILLLLINRKQTHSIPQLSDIIPLSQ